jgi:deoxyuridine 5'-triphosphate nucleotidohydrolase
MRLPHASDLPLPAYQSEFAAGLDLVAAVPADAPVIIAPGGRAAIPTGLTMALPPGVEGQIRPRSGLALRHGITVLNSPGTVDSDYRGEVQVTEDVGEGRVDIRGAVPDTDGADHARSPEIRHNLQLPAILRRRSRR